MTSSNLAIVITPSLMPMSDKMSVIQNPQKLNAHVRIVEVRSLLKMIWVLFQFSNRSLANICLIPDPYLKCWAHCSVT